MTAPRIKPMRRAALIATLISLTACAQFPELDATVTEDMRRAEYPALTPLSELENQPAPRITEASTGTLTSRIAALRARAARLSGPVISPASKARLRQRPSIR